MITLKKKILELNADSHVKETIYGMYEEMMSYDDEKGRHSDLRHKLTWAIKLPYNKIITYPALDPNLYCQEIYKRLDSEIYGMKLAKEEILQAINDRIYNSNSGRIIALKGKPGVGKTKLAQTIAKAIGLPFGKISLGGAIDSTMFKGSNSVWSGADPSLLLQVIAQLGCSNGVILLDEIDKLDASQKGIEVQHSLLHVLDPIQNKEHQDAFLCEYPHDLSKIWFIVTMNDDVKIDPTLKDRLNIIEVPPYSHDDMIEIVKLHSLPQTLIAKGIGKDDVTITNDGARTLFSKLGNEITQTGMRPVERAINDIVSKLNLLRTIGTSHTLPLTFKLTDFKGFPYKITASTINQLYNKIPSSSQYMNMYS